MNHEDYILMRGNSALEIARGMIDGSIHYLEGAIELSSLRFEVGLPEDDEDFFVFSGIVSEIDYLPIGLVRQHW